MILKYVCFTAELNFIQLIQNFIKIKYKSLISDLLAFLQHSKHITILFMLAFDLRFIYDHKLCKKTGIDANCYTGKSKIATDCKCISEDIILIILIIIYMIGRCDWCNAI